MWYKQFKDHRLSALGFGTMRLPQLDREPSHVDREEVDRMVDAAIDAGVNYFDTAYAYHDGMSEVTIGKSLARYPKEKWFLADKFPGHQNVRGVKELQPEPVFEEQLERCGVEYFDFYLLHNVNESSMRYYGNPEKHCLEYFVEQKQKGRIRHLGFSTHYGPNGLKRFLQEYGKEFEFCQIQLNYVDWRLQDAKQKCEILKEFGLPVWVMESVRGGRLAAFDADTEARMKALRPEESIAAWAFRWLQTVPEPTVILSGMSSLSQMEDNIRSFADERPMNSEELDLLDDIAEKLSGSIPCTGCRYCCAGCPLKLEIPTLMTMANEMEVGGNIQNTIMRYTGLGDGKRAADCVGCGQCREVCPQRIDVPKEMDRLVEVMARQKSWEEVCQEREAAAAAMTLGQV